MSFSNRTLCVIGGAFFLTVWLSSFVNTVFRFGSAWLAIAALAVTFILVLPAIHWTCSRMGRRMFLVLFLSLGFAVRLAWVAWNPALPESDFLFMYNAALSAVAGDYSFGESPYYTSFPYQFGFTMYEAFAIALFGSHHLFALKLINVLLSMGTALILYFAASRTFNESCGRIALLFYTFYVPHIIMCSVLTNQHISTFLLLLGCVLLVHKSDSAIYWLGAGLSLGLGHLMRPIGSIYLAGLVLFFVPLLWRLWRTSFRRRAVTMAARLAGAIAVFMLVELSASSLLLSSGVAGQPLSGGDKYWKFMVGLNAEANGSWNVDDSRYANRYAFGEERHRAELAKIKERLENKPEVAALMGRKLTLMWGPADSSPYWSLQGVNRPDIESMLNKLEQPLYVLMCAFGAISMILLWRSGRHERSYYYLIALLLYAAAHLLIEIQTRYRLDLLPVLILVQSYGAYQAYESVRKALRPALYSPGNSRGLGM